MPRIITTTNLKGKRGSRREKAHGLMLEPLAGDISTRRGSTAWGMQCTKLTIYRNRSAATDDKTQPWRPVSEMMHRNDHWDLLTDDVHGHWKTEDKSCNPGAEKRGINRNVKNQNIGRLQIKSWKVTGSKNEGCVEPKFLMYTYSKVSETKGREALYWSHHHLVKSWRKISINQHFLITFG